MDYSGKETVLAVVRKESADFFKLVDDPKNWNVQTRCTEWEVRDMVGHMIDVTEGYLQRWEKARKGETLSELILDWYFVPIRHYYKPDQIRTYLEGKGFTIENYLAHSGRFNSSSNFIFKARKPA